MAEIGDDVISKLVSSLDQLNATIGSTPAAGTSKTSSGGLEKFESELDNLIEQSGKLAESLSKSKDFTRVFTSAASDLERRMSELQVAAREEGAAGAAARAELKNLRTEYKFLNEAVAGAKARITELNSELKKTIGDRVFEGLGKKIGVGGEAVQSVFNQFKKVGQEALQQVSEGIKQAAGLAITAQEGVALEFSNQYTAIRSAFANLSDPNRAVTRDQLYAAEQGIVEAMGGLSEGLELDSGRVEQLVGNFREGLNSQITPTAETFRSLAQMGIEPTTEGLTQLREASGRAGLGLAQMNVLAKNASAIQIFGQGIVKTTLDLERMGISIQSMMRQSESYVTNLDGAIDSVAQLNQLGVQLDFGELTRLQEFDPAAAQQYIANSISAQQLQSSSFRALLGSIPGVNIEEILKLKNVRTGLESLQDGTTKQTDATGAATNAFTSIALVTKALAGSFVGTTAAAFGATLSLGSLAKSAFTISRLLDAAAAQAAARGTTGAPVGTGGTTSTGKPTTGTPVPTTGAPIPTTTAPSTVPTQASTLKASAGTGAAIGMTSGIMTIMQGGDWKKAIVMTIVPIIGTILGGAIGTAIVAGLAATGFGAPIAAAIGPTLITTLSALGGMASAAIANKVMDDGVSLPGYGDRTLVTAKGSYDLNNDDTVVAGTNLFGKGALQLGSKDSSVDMANVNRLIQKMDTLMATLNAAETTVVVNNTVQQRVNRTGLVSILTRNEGA